jgi:hypothetical protein
MKFKRQHYVLILLMASTYIAAHKIHACEDPVSNSHTLIDCVCVSMCLWITMACRLIWIQSMLNRPAELSVTKQKTNKL